MTGDRVFVGYNVQVAVDTEHHLIITHEVTNVGSDRAQLSPMAKAAKAALGVEKLDAVADRGYFSGEEILACDNAGVTVTLPKPMTSGMMARGRFGKQDFRYVADEDVYICPAGETLPYRYTNEEDGLILRRYWTNACQRLPYQEKLHQRQGATHHPMGARACSRNSAAQARRASRKDASAARNG